MKTLLAEQPLLVALMLAVAGAALVYGWLQTGKRAAAIAGVIALALIPLVWVLSQRWVTDRERVEQTIHEVARAVEADDLQRVLRVIGDADTRAQARAELPKYEFHEANVHRIRSIEIIDNTYPPRADVDMSVKVVVSQKRGVIQNQPVARRLLLTFEKRASDQWVVVDYRHMPLLGGPDAYSTGPGRPARRP